MRSLLSLMVLLPIGGSALSILVGRWRRAQRVVGVGVLSAVTAISVAILVEVDRHGPLVTQGGGWEAPLGISLVADRFSAIMLVVATVVLLAVLLYAIGQPGAERNHVGFQSVYLILAAGVSGSLLTGDLFNLFVSIEMMLTASYVLITLGGRLEQVRSGMTYVVISLLASMLFIAVIAYTYAATGTIALAQLSVEIASLPAGTRAALATSLLVVFGIKAALFPLHFWLPDSYPTAPSPVTAIFAGLLTKVGVYAIIRTQTLMFGPDALPGGLLMTVAVATMVIGGLGAIAQHDVKRILSFHIISQIGYMILGLALFTVVGIAGAIFHIVHNVVVKTTLFLSGGLIEHHGGSSRLDRLSGMVRSAPVIAVLFLLPALSLAGIPPLSGFGAKFALLDASVRSSYWTALAAGIVVSFLTLFSMIKIWVGVFWAPEGDPDLDAPTPGAGADEPTRSPGIGGPVLMVAPTAALVVITIAMGIFAGPFLELTTRAAGDLLDPTPYLDAVAGAGGGS